MIDMMERDSIIEAVVARLDNIIIVDSASVISEMRSFFNNVLRMTRMMDIMNVCVIKRLTMSSNMLMDSTYPG